MTRVTLLEKVYGNISPKELELTFSSLCKGLKVSLRVADKTDRGWIQIEVSGEDETVALHYLDQEVGLAPTSLNNLKKFSTIRGKIVSSGKSKDKLFVDIGIFYPRIYDTTVSIHNLNSKLTDGKKIPLKRLIELFCLCEYIPLTVKIIDYVDVNKEHIEADLSEAQLSKMMRWIQSNVDRLIVVGSLLTNVEQAIKASKRDKKIIKTEKLGLLEHTVVCKLGIKAVDLIPKLGRYLPTATFVPFSPRTIRQLINRPFGTFAMRTR